MPANGSWWTSSWKKSLYISGNYVIIGNTYGQRLGRYKISYVQETSYGYFIKIKGYDSFRWYRSQKYHLYRYTSASGSSGYSQERSMSFFGC